MQSHILIVDDDQEIRNILTDYWQQQNFAVTTLADGSMLLETLAHQQFDVIILDVMLPGSDGLELCQQIRAHHEIPILMLSAAASEADRIVGIEIGADDYLIKPFSLRELHARVKALLRREQGRIKRRKKDTPTVIHYQFADWILNTNKRHLMHNDGDVIHLSSGEYDLLLAFIQHPHKTLSREKLLDLTSRANDYKFERAIDSQVRRLRKKLKTASHTETTITTVRNGGYRFDCDVTEIEASATE